MKLDEYNDSYNDDSPFYQERHGYVKKDGLYGSEDDRFRERAKKLAMIKADSVLAPHPQAAISSLSFSQMRTEIAKVATELSAKVAPLAAELAAKITEDRLSKMSEQELDDKKALAFEKTLKDMDARDRAIKAREVKVKQVEQESDDRTADLDEELQELETAIRLAKMKLHVVEKDAYRIEAENTSQKRACNDKVMELARALKHLHNLEDKYGELEQKASDFVDTGLMEYFGMEAEEAEEAEDGEDTP